MPDDTPYQEAGWEEIAGDDEPVHCEQCNYQFRPFEEKCRRCGWRPGDPVDESVAAGPSYDELKAEQESSEREWQRCMWAAAITVCIAAPAGYLVGQFTADGPIGGAIIAALIGGVLAGLIARPDGEPLLGAVIGTICAIVYLLGALFVIASISRRRYGPDPSWETLMAVGVIGGTAASSGSAWYLSHRQQMF
jgi:hypothetical protein